MLCAYRDQCGFQLPNKLSASIGSASWKTRPVWSNNSSIKSGTGGKKTRPERTVVHMGNHRHITNVVLLVHKLTNLFDRELHLQASVHTAVNKLQRKKQWTLLERARTLLRGKLLSMRQEAKPTGMTCERQSRLERVGTILAGPPPAAQHGLVQPTRGGELLCSSA